VFDLSLFGQHSSQFFELFHEKNLGFAKPELNFSKKDKGGIVASLPVFTFF